MPTVQAYENGLTLGWAGGREPCVRGSVVYLGPGCCHREGCACLSGSRALCCAHAPSKRGEVVGWSAGAVRRHTAWLRSVDTQQLDGIGAAVTLTLLDCPPTSDDWTRLLKVLQQRLRRAGLLVRDGGKSSGGKDQTKRRLRDGKRDRVYVVSGDILSTR